MRFPFFFLSFFPLVKEKDEKFCSNPEKNDFDQRMACGAPVCWSKYTADINTIDLKDERWKNNL